STSRAESGLHSHEGPQGPSSPGPPQNPHQGASTPGAARTDIPDRGLVLSPLWGAPAAPLGGARTPHVSRNRAHHTPIDAQSGTGGGRGRPPADVGDQRGDLLDGGEAPDQRTGTDVAEELGLDRLHVLLLR